MRYRKSCPRVPLWTCTEGVAFEMNLRGISRVAMERDEKCYFRHSMNKANICKIQRMFEQRGSVQFGQKIIITIKNQREEKDCKNRFSLDTDNVACPKELTFSLVINLAPCFQEERDGKYRCMVDLKTVQNRLNGEKIAEESAAERPGTGFLKQSRKT